MKLLSRLLTASLVVAISCVPPPTKIAFKHAEKRGTLTTNGLKFVLMPDATTSLAEVDVRYDVGAREDYDGKAGLAHLIEHMMFQQRPIEGGPPLFQMIEGMAVTFNAYTNEDTTHYQNTVRPDNIADSLSIEAARMAYGCKTISEDQFEREREVVRNEIRQREGTPEGQIRPLVLKSIYPKGHAYERPEGGDDKELSNIKLDDVCKFMNDYYLPERATVIIAGNFNPDDVVALIEKSFAGINAPATKGGERPRKPMPRKAVTPVHPEKGSQEFTLDVERPSLHVAFALPASNTPEGEMAEYGIGNAFVRVLQKGQEYGFATGVYPQIFGGQLAPVFDMSIELKSEDKRAEALEFVEKSVKTAYRGFDEGSKDDIEEGQNLSKAELIERLEPLADRTNQVGDLVQFHSDEVDFSSDKLYVFHEFDKISQFDNAKVGAVVKKYINMDVARIVNIKSSKTGIHGDTRSDLTFQTKSDTQMVSSDVDTSEAHRPLKAPGQIKIMESVKTFTLDNGMKVELLPIHAMPIISAELVFAGAGTANSPDSPLIAETAADFMRMPADADAFQKTGVNVSCGAGTESTVCETGGINIYLDIMMKGFERLIMAGTYEQSSLESWQKQRKTSLESKATQQKLEFRRQYLSALFGPTHPYTVTGVETLAAVGKIHKDVLEGYRRSHYVAGNATLIVVGDFEPADAESTIRSTFGGWSKGGAAPVAIPKATSTAPAVIGVVGRELPQLEVQMGFATGNGVDGQEAARRVLAEMMNIRVGDVRFKLGSTYGLYAQHRVHRGPGSYVIAGGGVDAERAGESIKAIHDGLQMLRTGDHFDDDFVRARRKILSELLGVSTVTGELAGRIEYVSEYGLQPNYYNTLLQQVAAVSTAQIKALIASELDPSHEVLVVLGDRPHLEKAFADAGLKDSKIVEPDYK